MLLRWLLGSLCGISVSLGVSLAHAQCTKDTDCKGDRVCDTGNCVAAPAGLPPAPPAPTGAAAPAPSDPNASAVAPTTATAATPPATTPTPAAPAADAPGWVKAPPPETKRKRHSTGMMVGGIVMTSFAPVAFLVSLVAAAQQDSCELGGYFDSSYGTVYQNNCDDYDPTIYGGAIVGVALLGAGIPMIVIGAKKEPAPNTATATISPWVKPNAAGVGLRLDM